MAEKEKKENLEKEAESKERQPVAKASNSARDIRIGIIAGTILINIILLAIGLTVYLKNRWTRMIRGDQGRSRKKSPKKNSIKKTAVEKLPIPWTWLVNLAPPDQDTD